MFALQSPQELTNMLTPILHRKRKAAEAAAQAIKAAGGAIEQTKRVYGTRLLVRGLLWLSVYLLARGLLELTIPSAPARVAIALLPTPFFIYYLWTWMKGVGKMDDSTPHRARSAGLRLSRCGRRPDDARPPRPGDHLEPR